MLYRLNVIIQAINLLLNISDCNATAESALLTLGDDRTLYFRRQVISPEMNRKWVNDGDTLPFTLKHGSLFLLNPLDEKPTVVSTPEGPVTQRHQHGNVKFPDDNKLSVALALRAVTSKEKVYK